LHHPTEAAKDSASMPDARLALKRAASTAHAAAGPPPKSSPIAGAWAEGRRLIQVEVGNKL